MLLDHGADINEMNMITGERALHLAAKEGDESLIRLLLSEGACVSSRNNVGETPLHVSLPTILVRVLPFLSIQK